MKTPKNIILFSIAALIIAAPTASFAQSTADNFANTMLTQGHGEVIVSPDALRLTFGVNTEASTMDAARFENNRTMTAIIDSVKALKIANLKTETSNFYASPNYDERKRGYQINNQVTVTVTGGQTDMLEKQATQIIDTAMNKGATNVNSVQFFVDDVARVQHEALAKAVEDARKNANALADSLGVRISGVYSVDMSGFANPRPPMPYMTMRAEAKSDIASTPIEAGDSTVSQDVTVRFRFAPAQ